MNRYSFNCGSYLDPAARRVAVKAWGVVVVIIAIAIATGYGMYALGVLATAGLSTAVTEGCKALFQPRPRLT